MESKEEPHECQCWSQMKGEEEKKKDSPKLWPGKKKKRETKSRGESSFNCVEETGESWNMRQLRCKSSPILQQLLVYHDSICCLFNIPRQDH